YEIRRVNQRNQPTNSQEALAPLSELIPPQPNQFVRQSDDLIQLIVSSIGDKSFGGFEASDLKPTSADRKASRLVNFNHSLVKRFAGASVRRNTRLSETEVAEQMLQTAMSAIEYDPRDASYMSASDVARAGKAGRFGRAVFYTALLRAKRLPARLAVGLKVLDGTPPKLVDDVWVLVYADERWTAMDVTEGRIAAPDRIILSTTAMTDQESADALASALRIPPKVKVKVFRTQK
ncbi:MAG: transglutaminase domain-containing protein, partial [Planctomycetota bacterium]